MHSGGKLETGPFSFFSFLGQTEEQLADSPNEGVVQITLPWAQEPENIKADLERFLDDLKVFTLHSRQRGIQGLSIPVRRGVRMDDREELELLSDIKVLHIRFDSAEKVTRRDALTILAKAFNDKICFCDLQELYISGLDLKGFHWPWASTKNFTGNHAVDKVAERLKFAPKMQRSQFLATEEEGKEAYRVALEKLRLDLYGEGGTL